MTNKENCCTIYPEVMRMDKIENISDNRFKVINGEKYLISNRRLTHQRILYEIFETFRKYFKNKNYEPFLGQIDLILDSDNKEIAKYIIKPDIMVIQKEEYIKEDGIYGVPVLIVEIEVNATNYNKKKMKLYGKYGVKEYWIVDINKRLVKIYVLDNLNKYELISKILFNGIVKSKIFNGLEVDLKNIDNNKFRISC
ncbi:MAG: Uma2 family endonuclease [Clostridiales bacterium]|nr:Uma2 family endonuclease [Clostridiales bacterium]